MKNLKKVLTVIAVVGVLTLTAIEGIETYTIKGGWGYIPQQVDTI